MLSLLFYAGCCLGAYEINDSHKPVFIQSTKNNTADVSLTLEHVKTPEELAWGLMQRKFLPENTGMLFTFPDSQILTFWMFNTLIDLSVAFLDENHVIREIHNMKAYPQMMELLPPIKNPKDLAEYFPHDSISDFFWAHRVQSSFPAKYALEVNWGWFARHHIQEGDILIEQNHTSHGAIIRRR
jgi:uncharacterized protein